MFDFMNEDAPTRMPKRTRLAGLSPLEAIWALLAPVAVFVLQASIVAARFSELLVIIFVLLLLAWVSSRRSSRRG
jgi:hypothetical protein